MNNGSTLKTYKQVSTTHNYWENNKLTMNNGSTLKTYKHVSCTFKSIFSNITSFQYCSQHKFLTIF